MLSRFLLKCKVYVWSDRKGNTIKISTYFQPITYFHAKEKKMAERTKQGTKAKRSSTSKSKTREAANQLQNAAATEAAVGVLNTAEGAADLQAASDMSKA